MSDQSLAFQKQLLAQFKVRVFEENYPRIEKCLAELTDEQIWARPNDNLVSVGNLVLHLCGNVRQWVLSGLCGDSDIRERQAEFDEKGPMERSILFEKLKQLKQDISRALEEVRLEDLLNTHSVQDNFSESGVSILIHAIEHFSYHVGQITFATKLIKNKDLGYYGNLDL